MENYPLLHQFSTPNGIESAMRPLEEHCNLIIIWTHLVVVVKRGRADGWMTFSDCLVAASKMANEARGNPRTTQVL